MLLQFGLFSQCLVPQIHPCCYVSAWFTHFSCYTDSSYEYTTTHLTILLVIIPVLISFQVLPGLSFFFFYHTVGLLRILLYGIPSRQAQNLAGSQGMHTFNLSRSIPNCFHRHNENSSVSGCFTQFPAFGNIRP